MIDVYDSSLLSFLTSSISLELLPPESKLWPAWDQAIGPIVRLVGSGIGLASEAIAAREASKADKQKVKAQGSTTPPEPFPRLSASHSPGPSPDPPAYSTLDPASADYGLVEAEDERHAR